jgi:hypothetical protein
VAGPDWKCQRAGQPRSCSCKLQWQNGVRRERRASNPRGRNRNPDLPANRRWRSVASTATLEVNYFASTIESDDPGRTNRYALVS